jgi:hypothetical protein
MPDKGEIVQLLATYGNFHVCNEIKTADFIETDFHTFLEASFISVITNNIKI